MNITKPINSPCNNNFDWDSSWCYQYFWDWYTKCYSSCYYNYEWSSNCWLYNSWVSSSLCSSSSDFWDIFWWTFASFIICAIVAIYFIRRWCWVYNRDYIPPVQNHPQVMVVNPGYNPPPYYPPQQPPFHVPSQNGIKYMINNGNGNQYNN